MAQEPAGWDEFLTLCFETRDKKTLTMLFEFFFTQEERDDLGKRFLIIQEMLRGKKTQREISNDLNVSIAKVTRGSNELKKTNSELIQYLQQMMVTREGNIS